MAVVELVGHPRAQLVDDALDVHALEGERGEKAVELLGVVEVALDGLVDARVLDLDRHDPTVVQHRAVHLPDRGGGDGHRLPVEEQRLDVGAQLVANDLLGQARRHRFDVGLEGGERGLGLRRQALGDEAEHLARLHDGALHVPELTGDVLRAADGEALLQPGAGFLVGACTTDAKHGEVGGPAGRQAPDALLSVEARATVLVGQEPLAGDHPGDDPSDAHRGEQGDAGARHSVSVSYGRAGARNAPEAEAYPRTRSAICSRSGGGPLTSSVVMQVWRQRSRSSRILAGGPMRYTSSTIAVGTCAIASSLRPAR